MTVSSPSSVPRLRHLAARYARDGGGLVTVATECRLEGVRVAGSTAFVGKRDSDILFEVSLVKTTCPRCAEIG